MKPINLYPTEHEEQSALLEWVDMFGVKTYPELAYLYAVPNGGFRSKRTANELHSEGVRPGVPDLCLPVARHGFHGLYIEMKCHRKGSRLSEDQKRWINFLYAEGNFVAVCWDWIEAQSILVHYLTPSATMPAWTGSMKIAMYCDDQAEAE